MIGLNNARPSSTLWCWTGSYEGLYFIREAAEQDLYFASLGCQQAYTFSTFISNLLAPTLLGDHFSASVARPVEIDGKVVVPAGAEARGRIVEAVPQGRFKGAAVLRLVLESVTINRNAYDVKTSSVSHYLKGKGRRTATLIGGGAGGGALIGGLAGGGKGALIGAALGAGAGTAGAAYTGEKEIVLPAESTLSFKLAEPTTVKM